MPMPDDHAARTEALAIDRSFLVRAPAGSGKTELLIRRALTALATVPAPESVLAVTFTNKAANEMKQRILDALDTAARDPRPADDDPAADTWDLAQAVLAHDAEQGWDLRHNPGRLRVMTFDKLAARLAGQLPVLSGMGGPVAVEENPRLLFDNAVYSFFESAEKAEDDPALRDAATRLLSFADNRVDYLLPFLTDLLSRRDQWLGRLHAEAELDMDALLEGLVHERLEQADRILPETARATLARLVTAHADREPLAFGAEIDATWPAPTPEHLPVWQAFADLLMTKEGTFRKKLIKTQGFHWGEASTKEANEALAALQETPGAEEAMAEIRRLPEPVYPAAQHEFREALTYCLRHLVAHLRVVFGDHGRVDFTEIAQRALMALADTDHGLAALEREDYLLRHLLVDEQQDTSQSQYRLIELLTSGWEPGDGRTLFLVGDDQQSIYAFRGAEVRLFTELWETGWLGNVYLHPLALTANFRSDATLVETFNRYFRTIFPEESDPHAGVVAYAPSSAFKDDTPTTRADFHALAGATDADEAAYLVEKLNEAREEEPEASVAVLARSRGHLKHILPALKEAGIPVSAQGVYPLAESPAVADVIQLVRALWHPGERTAWVHLLRSPLVGLTWADTCALLEPAPKARVPDRIHAGSAFDALSKDGQIRIMRLRDTLEEAGADPVTGNDLRARVESCWYMLGGPAAVTPTEAEDVDRALNLLSDHCQGGELEDIEAFEVALSRLHAAPETGVVHVMTIHAAKGLGFDLVFLPGLGSPSGGNDTPLLRHRPLPGGALIAPNPGRRVPDEAPEKRLYRYLTHLDKQAEIHEQRRLLYVAMTRAKRQLHCLAAAEVGSNGKAKAASGSMLALLWPAVAGQFDTNPVAPRITQEEATLPTQTPTTHRLPADWFLPRPETVYNPSLSRRLIPSEAALFGDRLTEDEGEEDAEDTEVEGTDRFVARAVGIAYHALMDHMVRTQQFDLGPLRGGVAARLRREGVPEDDLVDAIPRVMELAANTLNSDVGRWILRHRPQGGSERALGGYVEGQWVAAVIDRDFIDDDATAWIIDYKTSAPKPGESKEAFLNREKTRYRGTMKQYDETMREYENRHSRLALFFPAIQELAVL